LTTEKCEKILIAPLDWGLGHTARCVPVIRYLRSLGHHVTFAGNEWQTHFISETFGDIDIIHLDGYDVRYGKTKSSFILTILTQLPRLYRTIRKEHEWLLQQTAKHNFDRIISDNRYGLYHARIPSVIMTHQLQLQSGINNTADDELRKLHYKYLDHFNECWVVDVEGTPNLSGKLAHPQKLLDNTHFIGLISQFEASHNPEEKTLVVLLSGPEPQRSILSDILWKQLKDYTGSVTFVEGSNNAEMRNEIPSNINYFRQITGTLLQPLLEEAKMVVCRSGYSTLMDLIALNKKAIIIPTPGQTEQEYLGKHLHAEGIFFNVEQKNFDLNATLGKTADFPFRKLQIQGAHTQFQKVINRWLNS
ncbi:MAG TPA: glycosyltransferase, partial [Flavipsychrobacter sp.]|nr:glycosyltransferase [Flavipsychrobacter sp.]